MKRAEARDVSRSLIIYPNCSKGGVSTVIRGRARADQGTIIDAVFFNDRGGLSAFEDLENVRVRIVRQDRAENYLKGALGKFDYKDISVLSHPATANALSTLSGKNVDYEFHSSDLNVVKREIEALDLSALNRVFVPSSFLHGEISQLVDEEYIHKLEVRENLVDRELFDSAGRADFFENGRWLDGGSLRPLVWIGRFDKGKGYQYFVRALALLPENYIGCMVVSLEDDPERANRLFLEAAEFGVSSRLRLFANMPQSSMANLLRSARDAGGCLVSTSLMESFGYAIAEALECELPVVAFDLPVLSSLASGAGSRISVVSSGAVKDLANRILESQ